MDPGYISYRLGTEYNNYVVDTFFSKYLLDKTTIKGKDQLEYQKHKLTNFELQNEVTIINIFEQYNFTVNEQFNERC